jgi:hypothetical protein
MVFVSSFSEKPKGLKLAIKLQIIFNTVKDNTSGKSMLRDSLNLEKITHIHGLNDDIE